MNVKKTKSSKKIVLKIAMSMTTPYVTTFIFFATLVFHDYEGFARHTAGHELSRPRGIGRN